MQIILARAGSVAVAGLMVGALGAAVAGRAVQSQLFGVDLTDAAIWIGVLGVILIAGAVSAISQHGAVRGSIRRSHCATSRGRLRSIAYKRGLLSAEFPSFFKFAQSGVNRN